MKEIFYNGTVVTLCGQTAEAIGVCDGRIVSVGTTDEVEKSLAGAVRTDLNGAALLPAFIDAHGHFAATAESLRETDGSCDIETLLTRLSERTAVSPDGTWIKARDFDPAVSADNRYPDRAELDRAAPHHPVVVQHPSRHMGVFNTAGLHAVGARTEDYPDGYAEETAYVRLCRKIPLPSPAEFLSAAEAAERLYLSNGIATVQEGMMTKELLPLYKHLSHRQPKIDIVGYPAPAAFGAYKEAFGVSDGYRRGFRIGGVKVILDGSPQAETVWLRAPYADGKNGTAAMTDAELADAIGLAYGEGVQILAHCNGDAAAAQFIRVLDRFGRRFPANRPPVMIHAQLTGIDQLDDIKRLGIVPSFFVAHTYHWGDTHIRNLGYDRAAHISPAESARKKGIAFTFHQDAPVIAPDMLETIWCARTRRTGSGRILGADQRVPAEDAVKAVTVHAAMQYGEANNKGALGPNYAADMVALSVNPLTASPEAIKEASVLFTVKDGRTVYSAR